MEQGNCHGYVALYCHATNAMPQKAKDLKDAAAKAACDALRATAKAALHVAEQAVKVPAKALDGAKLVLKGVLAAQHAAFAIFKMFASILPAIKLLKFSVTLMGAVIPAGFDFHIKLNIAGKDFDLRLRLNLADLAGMVKPLVDKAIAYLKSKISIPSISSFLGEEFLQAYTHARTYAQVNAHAHNHGRRMRRSCASPQPRSSSSSKN